MSYLSVFVQYHADVRVGASCRPRRSSRRPRSSRRSWSAKRGPDACAEEGEEQLWRVVQAGFRERRKMLHNVLPRQLPQVGRERFKAALAEVGIAPDRRPQTVSVEDWMALAAAIGPID